MLRPEEQKLDDILHGIDALFYLQSLTTLALASKEITLEEYELYRDYCLQEIVPHLEAQLAKPDEKLKK